MTRIVQLLVHVAAVMASASASTYTWPSDTDFLETLLYEQIGQDAFSPAAVVAPCGIVDLGKGRSVAAEWIRTAYHDMSTHDAEAGTGGLDASIGFELDRPENAGRPQFSETMLNMQQHLTARSSLADLVAMGAILSAGSCSQGDVMIPFRGGRIDATEAGPKGVPEPQQELDSHVAAFKRQGFNKTEMIGLVACGHTLGGIHGVDFPTIVDAPETDPNNTVKDDHTQTFDNTTNGFDNNVALDFVNKGQQNPLAFGHNETTRSDERIFSSDGMAEIKRLAADNESFLKTCTDLIGRMVDTVPKTVRLSEPVRAIVVKPSKLFATVNANNTMTFSGRVRLIDQFTPNPDRSVKIVLHNKYGDDCRQTKSCITTTAQVNEQSWTASSTGKAPEYPIFKKYYFTVDLPTDKSISSFNVEVTDKVDGTPKTITYDNNGQGFPFDDLLLPQPEQSCAERHAAGLFNLTVAVRNDAKLTDLTGEIEVPSSVADEDDLVPYLKTIPVKFTKQAEVPGSHYTFYNAQHTYTAGTYRRMYNLHTKKGSAAVSSIFNDSDELPVC